MSLEIDVFLKPDQLPAAYLLPNRVRYDLGMPYKVEITWGKTRGRVPVLLGDQQTGFEMYTGAMTKLDMRDEEIPAPATKAGRTYRVNVVWRRPLEGAAAAYAFAAAVAKMKSGYILDGLGGTHPFGGAPALASSRYWGTDVGRGIAIAP